MVSPVSSNGVTMTNTVIADWSGISGVQSEVKLAIVPTNTAGFTNGDVTTNDTTLLFPGGIHPEDFEIIPPNQDLYACDPVGQIVKLPASYLTNFVGDLMITDAGEYGDPSAKLFIVHWDAVTSNFITRSIQYIRPGPSNGRLEHVTFAPINLPPCNNYEEEFYRYSGGNLSANPACPRPRRVRL